MTLFGINLSSNLNYDIIYDKILHMDSKFQPALCEKEIYKLWQRDVLTKKSSEKPFTILMPPPNANASLHAGHGMYTVDDIMIRWKILQGYDAKWIPGLDHAGFETQYVFEKHLAKQGKSRMDFDRQTLYQDIFQFVKNNSGLIYEQFKQLGFLAQWERSVFTLDDHVLQTVFQTFERMIKEGYVYRSDYIVNYCTHCGTSFSELETDHMERIDPLYYIKYGPFVLATVRPETKFGDTALAVNPKDKRYKKWVGKVIEADGLLGRFKIKVIADDYVDPKFGTGVVKITPAHDPNDFLIGKKHNLEIKQIIDMNGRLNQLTGPYAGLKVKIARQKVVEDLKAKGLIEKIDEQYSHAVTVCYKCSYDLEPIIVPNWFIKVEDLKKSVIEAIKKDEIIFHPKRFKKQILQWLKVMHDWPISRQVIWGIRIPAWYNVQENPDIFVVFLDETKKQMQGKIKEILKTYSLSEVALGLQKLVAPKNASYTISQTTPGDQYLQETDTFDTWFSSGQWSLVTLKEEEYQTRYPTDLLGTLSDILPFWVSRMVMFSLYIKKIVPFKHVFLWSMVADAKGKKMAKSKGNVINPIDLVNKYGADALRAALLFGSTAGGKVNLGEDKVIGMRNFTNKIWNIGRFIQINQVQSSKCKVQSHSEKIKVKKNSEKIKKIINNLLKEYKEVEEKYQRAMEGYNFSRALGLVHRFLWHRFADYYIEKLKDAMRDGNIEVQSLLEEVYLGNLKLLHPFMPFVTDAVWQVFKGKGKSILSSKIKVQSSKLQFQVKS
ncbi:valine--tRNA ligase [Candidatus Roizmanbacteria bacterium CG_4_10_14_3_um_filter_33_21]|nr:MAG: valine--tRNA ligase [Candidatus Roizmanbacteria bacterium CG01_land_8_20_14_3_00_33_9]PIX72621.1 MAG: valine--tRNA ligase [Candidatus Roizmanbacteria bacterium CG_4_10_14_3_um_filter_33_21]